MSRFRGCFYFVLLLSNACAGHGPLAVAQAQASATPLATLHVDSRLVFLDTTVVDKKGNIVTSGLTKDDFVITEDKEPRRVFSFETPERHRGDEASDGEAPVTIFVVDQLNDVSTTAFKDFSFILDSVRKYLETQPERLDGPCELMLLGFHSLQMVQSLTYSKTEMLAALKRLSPSLPIGVSLSDRFNESNYALQLIALQNKGVPGRKNIMWVGYGAPVPPPNAQSAKSMNAINRFMHNTTNMLMDARVSLFLILPGIAPPGGQVLLQSGYFPADEAEKSFLLSGFRVDGDPFVNGLRFTSFAGATGGRLFYRNDVDNVVKRSRELGSGYYTLTYQPQQGPEDGRFRNIRVTMRNPELRAVTKTGYFAQDKADTADQGLHLMENMIVGVRSAVPLHGLSLRIEDLRWRPDTGTAQFSILLEADHLRWQAEADGQSTTHLFFAVANLNGRGDVLTSTYEPVTLTVARGEMTGKARIVGRVPVTFRVPPKTTHVRLVMETEDGNKLGSGDISRNLLDTAPQTVTPEPVLVARPPR